jgi:glycosyltransferase involved in cell wall biosynthesis
MQKLTAVIITLNEAKKIGVCLASLQGVADEVIVMDANSTDDTVVICKAAGVKVIVQPWLGYGKQKNFAASLAENDFILSMDADEALSPLLRESILKVKKSGLVGVYQMNMLNNYYGYNLYYGGYYPYVKTRIYNRQQVQWSERHVHETLVVPEGTPRTHLKGDILHSSKDSVDQHVASINRYTTLTAKVYFEQGKKGALFKMLFSPGFTFLVNYVFRLGFLDGYAGFIIARLSAKEAFLKYSKLLLMQRQPYGERK